MIEKAWHLVARSKEIKGNQPFSTSLLGTPLVLFRGKEGRLQCLHDLCPHRNAPLSLGKVVGDSIRCAYHGWRFSGGGQCVEVPSLMDPSKLPKRCIKSFPVIEEQGSIWVTLHTSVERSSFCGPGYDSGHAPAHASGRRWPYSRAEGYRSFELVTNVRAPFDLAVENFVDCTHTPFVHAGLFRSPSSRPATAIVRHTATGVKIETSEESGQKSLLGRLLGALGGAAPGTRQSTQHIDELILPATVRVDYRWGERHICSVSVCTPLDSENTRIFTRVFVRFGLHSMVIAWILKALTRKILSQDLIILEGQARRISEAGASSFTPVAADAPLCAVRRSLENYRNGKLPSAESRPITVQYRM